ncbi:hypothetical protein KQX54_016118 [Cotesia glomerata]|uniref:Uncharacterized protein n=1 Tax=Cotesia glomerata TaxID=32391 RepID=A0AAV7IWW5_COTGL|nr:hypothetical protein KQX54_016118 [Cotesia glomerata]
MSKLTKDLYTFKPFVLKEHAPIDDEDPEGRCNSKIYYKGYNLYIYGGLDPMVLDYNGRGHDVSKPEFRDMWVLFFDGKTIFTFFSLDCNGNVDENVDDDVYDDDDDDDGQHNHFIPYSFLKLAAFDVENRRWRMIYTHGDVALWKKSDKSK